MFSFNYKNKSIIAISDTHNRHRVLDIPLCDILIHCGDACNDGDISQLKDFFVWFNAQRARYKIFIAGNHDLIFDLEPDLALELIPNGIIFIEDGFIDIEGIRFSSINARPWLFMKTEIPVNTDILVTHAPAKGIMDEGIGCSILREIVFENKPKYHIFGHIHSFGRTMEIINDVNFINCSSY